MAFRGFPDKNHWFKYQKIRLRRFVSINVKEFVENGVGTRKLLLFYQEKKGKREKERKKEQEQKINAEKKLVLCPARASRPSAKRERRASG